MTAAEYRALLAAGKIKPASKQKRKATKRRALEDLATKTTRHTGGINLVKITTTWGECRMTHYLHPDHADEFSAAWRRAEKEYSESANKC